MNSLEIILGFKASLYELYNQRELFLTLEEVYSIYRMLDLLNTPIKEEDKEEVLKALEITAIALQRKIDLFSSIDKAKTYYSNLLETTLDLHEKIENDKKFDLSQY